MNFDSEGKADGQIDGRLGDDQIGLVTLLRLIWKWKIVVFAGVVVCALVALVISVLMPHVYEVDMLVENVQIGTNNVGEKVYLGNLKKTDNLVSSGAFNQSIFESLRKQYKDVLPKRVSFKVLLENDSQFARIVYESANVEMGEKILLQLFKRLQENNLVRIDHWKKEIERKIEEIALGAEAERLEKEKALAKIKVDKKAEKDKIKALQGNIKDIAVKRKIDISEKILDFLAKKKRGAAKIRDLDKRTAEDRSIIKAIEMEVSFLKGTRKKLYSTKNEIRDIVAVDGLSSSIMAGYLQLNQFRQKVLNNDNLKLNERVHIQELDDEIEKLKNESNITPPKITALHKEIEQAILNIEALESQERELSDVRGDVSSTDTSDKELEDAKSMNEIATLKSNKKKIKNIVLLQPPTSGVSPLMPDTGRNVIIGAVVGLFLSLFFSVFLEYVYKKDGRRKS
jgi:LPS O-antigen subunit length determinant protein (WzzB/FepE family)